jgi:hypothetical protein
MSIFHRGHLLALCMAGCGLPACTTGGEAPRSAIDGKSEPAVATFWVYRNGEFNWAGDYSWEAQVDFGDTTGRPEGHRHDIAVKITGKWGGFQPFAPGKRFDVSRYKYLVYSVKPTVPDQVYGVGFSALNDVPDGKLLTITGAPYGPTPVPGQWATYKIPLAAFELTNHLVQKFSIADGTGLPRNLLYIDNVGFTAD